jgi:hypothetical protein
MELSERSKVIIGQAIDEWFSTRPRLRAALEQEIPTIRNLVYGKVSDDPTFAILQAALDEADTQSNAALGIAGMVGTLMPFIIMMLG